MSNKLILLDSLGQDAFASTLRSEIRAVLDVPTFSSEKDIAMFIALIQKMINFEEKYIDTSTWSLKIFMEQHGYKFNNQSIPKLHRSTISTELEKSLHGEAIQNDK